MMRRPWLKSILFSVIKSSPHRMFRIIKEREGIEVSKQAEHVMLSITEHSVNTNRAIQEIHEALSEQTSSSHTIAQKIEQIALNAENAHNSAVGLKTITDDVNHTAKRLQELVSTYTLA